jgi:hypothetical protein
MSIYKGDGLKSDHDHFAGHQVHVEEALVGREHLSDTVAPHESYEGRHRYDPTATWTEEEERRVVWKTDIYLLSWLCVMFFGLQLDRGNLTNALTDNLLKDLNLSTNDYNNVSRQSQESRSTP